MNGKTSRFFLEALLTRIRAIKDRLEEGTGCYRTSSEIFEVQSATVGMEMVKVVHGKFGDHRTWTR